MSATPGTTAYWDERLGRYVGYFRMGVWGRRMIGRRRDHRFPPLAPPRDGPGPRSLRRRPGLTTTPTGKRTLPGHQHHASHVSHDLPPQSGHQHGPGGRQPDRTDLELPARRSGAGARPGGVVRRRLPLSRGRAGRDPRRPGHPALHRFRRSPQVSPPQSLWGRSPSPSGPSSA